MGFSLPATIEDNCATLCSLIKRQCLVAETHNHGFRWFSNVRFAATVACYLPLKIRVHRRSRLPICFAHKTTSLLRIAIYP